jgi:hypothetical protein
MTLIWNWVCEVYHLSINHEFILYYTLLVLKSVMHILFSCYILYKFIPGIVSNSFSIFSALFWR